VELAASLGFGIDAFHGVIHTQILENIATLAQDGAYLGSFSIPAQSRAAQLYLDAVDHAQRETASHPSTVHGQIQPRSAAPYGDVQFTERTKGSSLFVNPLMALYFTFDLQGLPGRMLQGCADLCRSVQPAAYLEGGQRHSARAGRRSDWPHHAIRRSRAARSIRNPGPAHCPVTDRRLL
jgi:hypothetical protein